MSQQQINNYHQPATQSLVNQQWSAPHSVHNHYYGQESAAYSSALNSGLGGQQWPVPDVLVPGFTPMGHGVQQQQPHLGGSNVQSHMGHVCKHMNEFAAERQRRILHALCNDVIDRSQHTRDCSSVGPKVTRESVDLFDHNEEKAKEKFWRRAQKNKSQRQVRAEEKQQKAQAKQPDLSQQWPANPPAYLQQMTDGNAGNFQADPNMDLNGMLPDYNAGGTVQMQVQIQMQTGAPQGLPLQDFPPLDLDLQVDPQLYL